jgi:hypothetical protein
MLKKMSARSPASPDRGGSAAPVATPAISAVRRLAARRSRLAEALYGLLVVTAAVLYFGQQGVFYSILPHSAAYLAAFLHPSRDVSPGLPQYALDVSAPRFDPHEYGAGPVVQLAEGRAIAVTSPVLRLMLPRMQRGDAYTVMASLVAPLPKPGRMVLLVGSEWSGQATVKGDGAKETVSWRVPADLFSGGLQSLRFCPDWPMAATLDSTQGRLAVWFYLTGLEVARAAVPASASGEQR